MKILGWIAWFAATVLVTALLEAWALQRLWSWFCAAQYGIGPTMPTWFGLSAIKGVLFENGKTPDLDDLELGTLVRKSREHRLLILAGLGIVWCVGAVIGWRA